MKPKINKNLFRMIDDVITEHPDWHDQSSWQDSYSPMSSCGTTRCVAGWAQFFVKGKVAGDTPGVAQQLLGLTGDEAHELFYSMNNTSVRYAVKQYAENGREDDE